MSPEPPRPFQFTLRRALLAFVILSPCMLLLSAILRRPTIFLLPLVTFVAVGAIVAMQALVLLVVDYFFGIRARKPKKPEP
ncbi:MAG: hypothetical protein AB7U73_23825 [Pirellulales bacterium]